VRPHYAVITDRFKLVHFYGTKVDYWELFDLQKDPQEMSSVYDNTEYRKTRDELLVELKRLQTELKVPADHPREWFGSTRGEERAPGPKN
jgi:hypothetical protein